MQGSDGKGSREHYLEGGGCVMCVYRCDLFCHQKLATFLRECKHYYTDNTVTGSLDHCREISPKAKVITNVIDILFVIVRDADYCLVIDGDLLFCFRTIYRSACPSENHTFLTMRSKSSSPSMNSITT